LYCRPYALYRHGFFIFLSLFVRIGIEVFQVEARDNNRRSTQDALTCFFAADIDNRCVLSIHFKSTLPRFAHAVGQQRF